MADWVFLDHHTKTRPSKALGQQLARDEENHWIIGPTSKVERELLGLLGLKKGRVELVTSGVQAVQKTLFSHYINDIRTSGRTQVLASTAEMGSILKSIEALEQFEVRGKRLEVTEMGHLTRASLEEAIRARTSLLSLSLAHPLTGVVQPIHDLLEVCKEHEVAVHLDISAAIGKLFFTLDGIDYLTLDGGLLGCPGGFAAAVDTKNDGSEIERYAPLAALKGAVEMVHEKIDHYAMEVGRLRSLLEKGVEELGGRCFFTEVERLPNTSVVAFEGLHGQVLLQRLKKEGIFATTGGGELERVLTSCHVDPSMAACGVSFALSDETSEQDIKRVIEAMGSLLATRKPARLFTKEEAAAKAMRLCYAEVGTGTSLKLSLLIDEEDGVIADAKAAVFGPPELEKGAEAAADLLVRKNYMQARRLSAALIEGKAGEEASPYLNLILEAIDQATEGCMDIPIDDVYVAPPNMEGGERQEYPGWSELSNEKRKAVVAAVMETEVRPFVELDAGGVEVVKVEDNRVTIAYSGNCTSCFSATGATLDAIGNILRHKVYPDLMVIPDLSVLSPEAKGF